MRNKPARPVSQSQLQRARAICLFSIAILLVVYAIKTLYLLDQPLSVQLFIYFFQCLPFALLMPGMLRSSWRSFAWLTFVILLYFMQGVLALFETPKGILEWLLIVLIVIIYLSALLFVRWARIREANQSALLQG